MGDCRFALLFFALDIACLVNLCIVSLCGARLG